MAAALGWPDWAVLAASLGLSAGVGLWRGGRPSGADFFLGGRRMPVVPTALSVLVSFLSGILILAVPAEIYEHGALMWLYMAVGCVSMAVNAAVFLPVLHARPSTSVYEYLEWRFGSPPLRRVAAALFLLSTLTYVSIVMYAPAAALAAASGAPVAAWLVSVGVVSTLYTSVGGLRAVVWADSVQAALMLAGLVLLVVKGAADVGGFGAVFHAALEEGRLAPLANVDPNPLQYFSVWIALVGGFGFWLVQYGLNQMAVQRYRSMATLRQARVVVGLTAPCYLVLTTLSALVGLIMVARFRHCDPVAAGRIAGRDQLVMHFVVETLGSTPGLTGVFLACLCSGTLSTVSSGINSMAAVTWEDLVVPFWRPTGALAERAPQLLALGYGAASLALAFACEPLGGMLKAATNLMGLLGGPVVGLFALGVLSRRPPRAAAAVAALLVVAPPLVAVCVGNLLAKPFARHSLVDGNATVCVGQPAVSLTLSVYGDTTVLAPFRLSTWLYPTIGAAGVLAVGALFALFVRSDRVAESKSVEMASAPVTTD